MRRTRSLPLLFAVLPLSAVLALSAAARADTVGTAGAVNTATSGTAPGASTRVIEIGAQVVENEKIQTTASGSVQVLFIDKTTLNVGPNSTLVIDRFVYNPATTKGELALSLGKGVMRVVGGVATHSEGAAIRTPVAAIGLRGGIAIISHSSANGTRAILGFGHMSVTSLCGGGSDCHPTTTDVSRPGFVVKVAGLNLQPSSPGRASSQELAEANGQLTSKGGQTGGASQQPTDDQAKNYNVGTSTSPGAQMIQTASQGRANALTAANAMGQTVAQGAQNSASTGTATRVALQNAVQALTPVKPPPIVPRRSFHRRSFHRRSFRLSGRLPPRLTRWSPPGLSAPARARALYPISPAPSPEAAASRSRRSLAIRQAASMRTERRIRPQDSSKLASA